MVTTLCVLRFKYSIVLDPLYDSSLHNSDDFCQVNYVNSSKITLKVPWSLELNILLGPLERSLLISCSLTCAFYWHVCSNTWHIFCLLDNLMEVARRVICFSRRWAGDLVTVSLWTSRWITDVQTSFNIFCTLDCAQYTYCWMSVLLNKGFPFVSD